MIIFYEKSTGKIVGTIDGRVHGEDHLRMWVGDENNGRIVLQWKKNNLGKFEPEDPILEELENSRSVSSSFKVSDGKVVRL